jgi:hypothetical protein
MNGVKSQFCGTLICRHFMRYFFTALFSFLLVGCDIPNGTDQAEATKVVNGIEAHYQFRVMSTRDKRPAVYELPHTRYSEVLVYGDYTKAEQDAILAVARAVRKEVATKPVVISFYPKEHVQENLIRQERIE